MGRRGGVVGRGNRVAGGGPGVGFRVEDLNPSVLWENRMPERAGCRKRKSEQTRCAGRGGRPDRLSTWGAIDAKNVGSADRRYSGVRLTQAQVSRRRRGDRRPDRFSGLGARSGWCGGRRRAAQTRSPSHGGGRSGLLLSPCAASRSAGSLSLSPRQQRGVLPDPAARFQPEGPHGPSEVIDPTQSGWSDQNWHGPALPGQILYEMHIGTFTAEGTWLAVARQLPELAAAGIGLIEMMPVADFPGSWSRYGRMMRSFRGRGRAASKGPCCRRRPSCCASSGTARIGLCS